MSAIATVADLTVNAKLQLDGHAWAVQAILPGGFEGQVVVDLRSLSVLSLERSVRGQLSQPISVLARTSRPVVLLGA